MAVRPRKTRPDARSRAAAAAVAAAAATATTAAAATEEGGDGAVEEEEQWFMKTLDGQEMFWLPRHVVKLDPTAPAPPLPPPAQPDAAAAAEAGDASEAGRGSMLQQIRDFKPKKKKSSRGAMGPLSPEDEARAKRCATVKELIETEEELTRDLHYAVENYYKHMDLATTPRHIRDHKEVIFGNFSFFPDFHKNVLIEGIKYHAEIPRMIGKTFLRLERDFDQHAEYCSTEPLAQEFLENNAPVRDYFEEHSQSIGDDKRIQEHLQLPIQRLNDYQLLLRELVKYGKVLGDDTEELEKALELMQTIPQRATDAKFIASIEGFRGNLYKLGRLIRHDWFSVQEAGHQRAHDRYLFLFKARVLVTKVRRVAGDRSVFLLKHVIRLPETSLGSLEHPKKLEFIHIEASAHPNYPVQIEARTVESRDAWLEVVQEHVVETASVDDLLFDDEIRIVSEEGEDLDEGKGAISPLQENIEDFPQDFAEDLPEDLPSQEPVGRIVPIVLEEDQLQEQEEGHLQEKEKEPKEELKKARAKGDEDDSPLPVRKKARSELLEQVEQLGQLDPLEQLLQLEQQVEQVHEVTQSHQQEEETFFEETSTIVRSSKTIIESSTVVETSTLEVGALQQRQVEITEITQADSNSEYLISASVDRFAEAPSKSVVTAENASVLKTEEVVEEERRQEQDHEEETRRNEEEIRKHEEEETIRKEETRRKEEEIRRQEEEETIRKEETRRKEEEIRRQEEETRKHEEEIRRQEEEIRRQEEETRKHKEEIRRQEEEIRKEEEEIKRKEEETRKQEEEERIRKEEEKKEEERIRKEDEERKEEERIRKEEKERKEEEERLEKVRKREEEKEEQRKREEKERQEEEERIKKEEVKRKEEEATKKREEEEAEEKRKREEEETRRKEEEETRRKEEAAKARKEEEERLIRELEEEKKVEEERVKIEKERQERLRKEEEEKKREERRIKEEEERQAKEEEEKRVKEEEERLRRRIEEEEKAREVEEERKRRVEEERALREEEEKREEAERIKRKEEKAEKLRKKEEEKVNEEKERKESERKQREEEKRKEEEETRKKEEEEREEQRVLLKKRKVEEEKRRQEEEETRKKEGEEEEKREKERRKREEERKRKEEDRRKKEEERLEKLLKEEEIRKGKEEQVRRQDKEREERLEEERRKRQEERSRKQEEEERKVREEEERLEKEREKKKKEEGEKQRKEIEEWNKLEQEIKQKEEIKRLRKEEETRRKEEERKKREEERLRKEEEALEKRRKEEEKRKREDGDLKKLKEEEEEEKKRKDKEESKKKREEEKKVKEEEKKKKKEEKEKERKEKEEEVKKEEEKKRQEEEKTRKEEALKKEEEKIRKEKEEALKKEEEKERKKEEALKKEEEKERKLKEEEEERSREETKSLESRKRSAAAADEAAAAAAEEPSSKTPRMSQAGSPNGGPRPVIITPLTGAAVEPGDSATFTCTVTHPTPYCVTWFKDNKVMDDKLADRVKQTDEGGRHTLTIMNCQTTDSGVYCAKATDEAQASISCSAQLLVHQLSQEERAARSADKKPFFLVKLLDASVAENTNLSYVVHVKGDPMPEVKFYKGSSILQEDNRIKVHRNKDLGHYELLFSHITHADAAVYKCTAMNIHGEDECMATMTVTDTEDAPAGFGTSFLKLEASGTPRGFTTYAAATKEGEDPSKLRGKGSLLQKGEKAEFEWFRDGQKMDAMERFTVHYKEEEDTLALIFQNVTPDDAGLYTCVASTSCGRISCSAELTVEGSVKKLAKDPVPPTIIEGLTDIAVSVGSSAMLEVRILAYPKPELTWTRNGLDVKIGGRIKQMWEDDETVSLIIKNVKDEDAGIYRMVAKNDIGETDSDCKMAIRAAPKFRRMVKEVACVIGEPLNQHVEVDAEPAAELRWFKDGKELSEDDRMRFVMETKSHYVFKISAMEVEDCGTYTVTASNDMGQRSENFDVRCDCPPTITRGFDPETEKKLSNDHTFEVRASGSPAPIAKWFKDNKELSADDKFRMLKDDAFYMLKIRRLDRKDKGLYRIVLTNSSGECESEGLLIVRAPAEFITPLKDACAKEGSKDIKLFVEFSGTPKPSVKWMFNDRPIRVESEGYTLKTTDNTTMLIIHNALPEFVGNYTITLGNEYGDSVGKGKFRLHEPPKIIEPLVDTEFLEALEAKIAFKATGIPIPEIKWLKDGQKYVADEKRVKAKKEGEPVFVLFTEDAQTQDSGHYVATITNCEGTATTEATFTINTPPRIVGSNFREGKRVIAVHKFVLEVEATAVPEADAHWFLNGVEIEASEDIKIGCSGNKYTLERFGCDPEHSGEYSCKLKNKIKEEVETGNVEIYEKESRVRRPLKDLYVKEFSTATISCQIVGDPVPTVEWLRDGKPLSLGAKFETTEDRSTNVHTLVMQDVHEKERCVLSIKGHNQHGDCETSCKLGVLVKPMPGELKDNTVDYGSEIRLAVNIHAYPPPVLVWTHNGKEIVDCEHTQYLRDEETEVYTLLLSSAVLEDIGAYAFTATNEAGERGGDMKLHVHSVKPSVSLDLKSESVCLEDEVTFKLRCCGLPLPTAKWTMKGELKTASERTIFLNPEDDIHTITFKDIAMEDYGKLEVVVTSLVGSAMSWCELTQKVIPCEVLQGMDNVTMGADGEDVTLTVFIKASPRPVIVWTKDGDHITDSDKVKITVEKITYCDLKMHLTLIEAGSMDSGQYRVKFSNLCNEETNETALCVRPVRKRPRIPKKPADVDVTEKSAAMFKCKINGFPRPDVKWLKDGRIVRPTDVINMGMASDGQFFLELRHCSVEDAGEYTIVAENEEGKTEACMKLTICPPPSKPEFLQGLRATRVIAGYPCRLEVKCGGFPKPTIQWLKDGSPLKVDGVHLKEVQLEDGTILLVMDVATAADGGLYSCVASNADGETTSSADITVLGRPRKDGQPDGPAAFTSGLKDTTVDEGQTLILPVAVKGGPVPTMTWYKDGEPITLDDSRCFFTYDGDRSFLEIRQCTASDSGEYRCMVVGDDGSRAATECVVNIRKCFEAPSFEQAFNPTQQMPTLDIRLCVKVDGLPRPDLAWFKDNKPLDLSTDHYKFRKDGDATWLVVKECVYGDSGIYKCVASNREGSAEHQAAVEVVDEIDPNQSASPPVFLKAIGDQELFENDHARFKAVVSGRPIPDFQWLKDGKLIIESNRIIPERDVEGLIRLTIRHICEADAGVYTLKVWNKSGKKSCTGKLICECISKKKRRPLGDEYKGYEKLKRTGVPVPLPDKPYISALSDRRATVSWNPFIAQGPQPPVTYQVEMCESPQGEWYTARTGVRGTSLDITNLGPKNDYKFRIRVENKHGVSEPSPYAATYRHKLEVPTINYEPTLTPNYEQSSEGPYVPSGFAIKRTDDGNYFAAPRFLRLEHDTQYGQKKFNSCLKWYAYGYPTPKVHFTFKGKPLATGVTGSRIKHTQEATGEIVLYIDKVADKDCGLYECFVKNEHGESKQRLYFGLSEYPRVTQHLEETHVRSHATGRLTCRIAGFPPCDVTWYKDWEPLRPTFRLKPQFIEPDLYVLNLNGTILGDSGLYSLSAVNVAGVATSSALLQVEDDDNCFVWTGPGRGRAVAINKRRGQLEDHYDVGDELGRGTQGITYHCVEHYTGRNFAAKSMWGRDNFKVWMQLEHEMMNLANSSRHIVRVFDAYESPKNLVIVMDLCAGGELLHSLTQHQYITEFEVAHYVRQILEGLEYLHDRCIAHLGLNIGDIMLTHPNGTNIKFGDLSLARTIRQCKLLTLDYGMPEYVAPEVAGQRGVSYPADMWAVGVITYLLLSGTSPFRGENDKETLTKVKKGELTFNVDAFTNISRECKDFIAKLLQFKPEQRMEVKQALHHTWLLESQLCPRDPYKINTDNLRTYQAKFSDWYTNASCRRWYRRRTLQSAFTHPSKMVYPPGEVYTPPDSPDRALEVVPAGGSDYTIPHKSLEYEVEDFTADSRYQQGPDTFLLQLRDVDFPVRLRQYMKVAANRSPAYAAQIRENLYDYENATPMDDEKRQRLQDKPRHDAIQTVYSLRAKYDTSTYDYCCSAGEINLDRYIRIPVVHERRRFTDIMDEEIDDERRRTVVDRYTVGFTRANAATCSLDLPRRVIQEVRTRPASSATTPLSLPCPEGAVKSPAPFMREKPQTDSIGGGRPITLSLLTTGEPAPLVQWYKNDIILNESGRLLITTEVEDGNNLRSTLKISESREGDVGSYRVVARNKHGQATHRFRLVQAALPSICDCPEVGGMSDTSVLMQWRPPLEDGGARLQCYHLQMKGPGDVSWSTVDDALDMERSVVGQLKADSLYQFRVAAKNTLGWGDFSVATPAIRTGVKGCPKLAVPVAMGVETQRGGAVILRPKKEARIDYTKEDDPIIVKTGEGADMQIRKYVVVDDLHKGRFSTIGRAARPDDHMVFALKFLDVENREELVRLELDLLRSLRHERLSLMHEAYEFNDVVVVVEELLSGLNVVQWLSLRHEYSEQTIATFITQLLDGLSYLQWRGMCHLDLQPSNLVLVSNRYPSLKIVDFGSARRVAPNGTAVPINGLIDYIAPEVLFEGKAYPNSDIWSLGVLVYVLITGMTPFRGSTDEDVKANIQCVRYKFEWLPATTTQEATRFLMLIFKRDPSKRPTVTECLEHRWLDETEFMVRKRERANIITNRIRDYNQQYSAQANKHLTKNKTLLTFKGLKR